MFAFSRISCMTKMIRLCHQLEQDRITPEYALSKLDNISGDTFVQVSINYLVAENRFYPKNVAVSILADALNHHTTFMHNPMWNSNTNKWDNNKDYLITVKHRKATTKELHYAKSLDTSYLYINPHLRVEHVDSHYLLKHVQHIILYLESYKYNKFEKFIIKLLTFWYDHPAHVDKKAQAIDQHEVNNS